MDLSKNARLLAALVLIIITTIIIGTVFSYCLNFLLGLSVNSFETGDKIYLTGYDSDLEECWDLIRKKNEPSYYSISLFDFTLNREKDGQVESFILSYYLQKDGEWYSYSATYRDNPNQPGGGIKIRNYPVKPKAPDFVTEYPLDPAEFLKDLDRINLTYLGYEDSVLGIESDNTRGVSYTDRPKDRIYLQNKDLLLPLEEISFENGMYPAFPVMLFKMSCSDYYGNISCSSSEVSIIFSGNRLKDADFSFLNGGKNDEKRRPVAGGEVRSDGQNG